MRELEYPFDSKMILRRRKYLRRKLMDQKEMTKKNIAVLGGSTTHDIREILELFLLNYGIQPQFFESEYAQYWQDAVFGNEQLEALQPDIIYIHTSNRNISVFPQQGDSEEEVSRLLSWQYSHFEQMWEKLEQQYHCPVIQNNFEYPYYRLLGNQDAVRVHGRTNFITRLNQKFYDYANAHEQFFINDINYQSADYGLKKWLDPFFWHMYKYCLCQEAVPVLAFHVANIMKSILGKNKKALAVDLDQTLWGGIVGDDGVEHLELGPETSIGQAYMEFQCYLKELKEQGILLNVISKNEKENALAGLRHPQMVLKPEDFIIIKADWEPKSTSLIQMAGELSLLPESFVFVDDNPAERELVRQQVKGAAVPLMDRPEHYIYAIDRSGCFETTYVSADDRKRSEMYQQNIRREAVKNSFSDYQDYLLSLNMHAQIQPFEDVYMARIAQLTNKSNQFNLTTRRFTEAKIRSYAQREDSICLYGKLSDRFGDNGVVSVVMGRQDQDLFHIELWLMSCRVLKRGMEEAMMDELVKHAGSRGVHRLKGYYYKTSKNAMVKDFYSSFGFKKLSENEAGDSEWILQTDHYQYRNQVIKIQ